MLVISLEFKWTESGVLPSFPWAYIMQFMCGNVVATITNYSRIYSMMRYTNSDLHSGYKELICSWMAAVMVIMSGVLAV